MDLWEMGIGNERHGFTSCYFHDAFCLEDGDVLCHIGKVSKVQPKLSQDGAIER